MAKDLYASLDLNLLRTFVILSQELNMRKASERLFVSQPAISQALQKLRSHFDDELFVKTRHGLKPTALGIELAENISPLLDELSSTLNAGNTFSPSQLEGTLKLALTPNILTYLSTPLYLKIRQAAPNVNLHLHNWSPTSLEEINNGEISLGVNFEIHHAPKELIQKKICDDKFTVYVRKDHPLSKTTITPKDLDGLEAASIIISDWNSNIPVAEKVMRSHGFTIRTAFRSELPMAILDIIKHTDMFFPASSFLPKEERDQLRGLKLKINNQDLKIPLMAYYHQRNRRSPLITWLLGLIEESLQEYTAGKQ
ncbi:LysR family transcriptional regulator [Photobacterium sp. BZF1]|uniref:LysR family transcriptional regulator n=1 Tax=Photobacterium sp. BZF1 TaxID=1904457 RepID=UPI001653AB65|nr:LysR family transcriptional regulator [Photobacterium sp. BZF1]MBC7003049.1 LysR family transcriptional regulator [Photobacterium sp. BZF1]